MPPRSIRPGLSVVLALLAFASCDDSNPPKVGEPDGRDRAGGVTCPAATQGVATEAAFGALKFNRPTHLEQKTLKGESFWYVVEQRGVIKRFRHNQAGTPKPETVADLTARVFSEEDDAGNEAGMFSIAFHPNFEKKGKTGFGEVFITYTGKGDGPVNLQSRISRFKSKDGGKTLDGASEEVLLRVTQPFTNHNGGALAFGPDGFLYIGFGDGGSAGDPFGNGQTLGNTIGCKTGIDQCALLGKILRIDVDVDFKADRPFAIPKDNPFSKNDLCSTRTEAEDQDETPDECAELYAWGIRNPWKFSFDPADGKLWLGDVGQNTQEEVDIIEKGGNYGWSVREGELCFNPAKNCPDKGKADGKKFKAPVAVYGTNVGRSITGGYVYRGTAMPSMVGQYIYADIASGRFLATLPKTKTTFATRVAHAGTVQPVGFGVAADGELFTIDFAKGGIHKVVEGQCTDGSVPPAPKEYLFLSRDGVGTEEEATGYYKSILPASQVKTLTLEAWKKDRFAKQKIISVFFRNTADLGFWREMSCTQSIGKGFGGCAVRNWREAADKDDPKKKDLGTVTMDVSPEGFTRFYVFAPGGKISTKAVLDSEKEKFVPRLCTPCHNGLYLGPASNGNMVSIFREFEPSLFELPEGTTAKQRKEAEDAWFDLNQAVKSANLSLTREEDGGPTGINHAVDAVNSYIDKMYPQDRPPARPVTDPAHIPPSWKVGSAAQKKLQAELWTKAINPTCMGCHRTNTHDFAQFSVFQQLGPDATGSSVLQKYLAMKKADGKQPLAIMPQSELLFENLLKNQEAVDAIKAWLGAVRGSRGQ